MERDTWVYADPHFGHENIIKYAQRPFPNADKMDGELVTRYNSVVKKQDIVYWLGDVTLKSPEKKNWLRRIIGKMNGTKVLVFGNHDDWHWQHYLDVGFQSCHTFLELNIPGEVVERDFGERSFEEETSTKVRLCHDPAWAQDKSALWICGHLHNCAFTAPYHIAIVCVELTDYKPVLINDVVAGLRPGEGVLRTPPRPNREPKDWDSYAPNGVVKEE